MTDLITSGFVVLDNGNFKGGFIFFGFRLEAFRDVIMTFHALRSPPATVSNNENNESKQYMGRISLLMFAAMFKCRKGT